VSSTKHCNLLNHRQEIYAEFFLSCRQFSHVFHGAEEPLVDVSHALARNFPSVGYGMEDRFTLGERIVNK
jgi:hypothetical protein